MTSQMGVSSRTWSERALRAGVQASFEAPSYIFSLLNTKSGLIVELLLALSVEHRSKFLNEITMSKHQFFKVCTPNALLLLNDGNRKSYAFRFAPDIWSFCCSGY